MKLERLDPEPSLDVRASQIMESVGETPQGLRILVERYGGSLSVNIANSLAFILNRKSSHSTYETAPLVFEFAFNVKRHDSNGVLMNTLNAMKNQISFGWLGQYTSTTASNFSLSGARPQFHW